MSLSRCVLASRLLSCRLPHLSCLRYSSGRNVYIEGASNKANISEEVRDLIRNQRTADNMEVWQREAGLQDPKRLSMRNEDDVDDDQTPDAVYYPHRGEEWNEEYNPSPVLLVKRIKRLAGEPYWHKETMSRLGLGAECSIHKIAVVPNMPSFAYKLFSVKHLVEIIPVKFPMGFPDDDEFDPSCCRINHKGEFYYHKKLRVDVDKVGARKTLKIEPEHIQKSCYVNWFRTQGTSPLGNSNYDRDLRKVNTKNTNFATDPNFKPKFHEDVKEFTRNLK